SSGPDTRRESLSLFHPPARSSTSKPFGREFGVEDSLEGASFPSGPWIKGKPATTRTGFVPQRACLRRQLLGQLPKLLGRWYPCHRSGPPRCVPFGFFSYHRW